MSRNTKPVPLAQSVEHQTFNLRAAGSSPAGDSFRDTHSNFLFYFDYENQMCLATTNNNGSMAEWSNATDLSSVSFGSAGSNPAGTILGYHTATTMNFELSSTALCFAASNPATPIKGVYPSGQRGFFNTMVSDNNNTVPLAQSVEHETFNLRAAGSSPAGGFLETHTATFSSLLLLITETQMCLATNNKGAMAEWSNATDLSSVLFGGAGSNPAGATSRISHSKFITVYLEKTIMKSDNNNKVP